MECTKAELITRCTQVLRLGTSRIYKRRQCSRLVQQPKGKTPHTLRKQQCSSSEAVGVQKGPRLASAPQGTRILDLACDIAADRSDQPLHVWEAVEKDIVGHASVRWKAQALFRLAVLSAWLRAHHKGLRFVARPIIRSIAGMAPLTHSFKLFKLLLPSDGLRPRLRFASRNQIRSLLLTSGHGVLCVTPEHRVHSIQN